MRTEELQLGTIHYPDEVVFAYNPNYIEFVGFRDIQEVTLTIVNSRLGERRTITAALINGSAKVYISKFLQLLLHGDRSFRLYTQINAGNETITINYLCIDGSLNIGERFGQIGSFVYDPEEMHFIRRVRWFKNFPFSVSVFAKEDMTLSYRYDRNTYSGTLNVSGVGYTDLDPKRYIGNANTQGVFKIEPKGGAKTSSAFDKTYDYTFKNLLESVQFVRMYVDNSTCGHYFRWIDPLGQLQYFLFTKGVEQIKVSDSEQIEEEVESSGIYFGRIMRTLEKSRTREIKCCAANLTRDEQEYVKTIVSSIKCEMFIGGDIWIPANVKAGSFSISEKEDLQDFEITAELPISQTQTR